MGLIRSVLTRLYKEPPNIEKYPASTIKYTSSSEDPRVKEFVLPLNAEEIWDETFAFTLCFNIYVSENGSLRDVSVLLGDGERIIVGFKKWDFADPHFVSSWRFDARPEKPFIRISITLADSEAPITVTVNSIYAGLDYDPYVMNPAFSKPQATTLLSNIPDRGKLLADFEAMAREQAKTEKFYNSQSFIKPFLVFREGFPSFPMLVGTVNSLLWYAVHPKHGIECYIDWGLITKDDRVIDCGAHAGQMSTIFSIVAGKNGAVLAFDPFVQNTMQCEFQARLNPVAKSEVVQAGLGERRDVLKVSNDNQKIVESGTSTNDTEIRIVPLDDYIAFKPTFLKIDIEGAEVHALRGAQKLLRKCKPKLFFEVHTSFLPGFDTDLTEFFSLIPTDIYDIEYILDGASGDWQPYQKGDEIGVTVPMFVRAFPRDRRHLPVTLSMTDLQTNSQFIPLDTMLQIRESDIRNLTDLVKQREQEIRNIADIVTVREENIVRLENLVREYSQELSVRSSIVTIREDRIRELEGYIRKLGY